MDMIPNEWGVWAVSRWKLRESLNEIHKKGGEQISVVPELPGGPPEDYLIIFFTPPINPPESTDGAPVGATIQ